MVGYPFFFLSVVFDFWFVLVCFWCLKFQSGFKIRKLKPQNVKTPNRLTIVIEFVLVLICEIQRLFG